MKKQILIADSEEVFRKGLNSVLTENYNIDIYEVCSSKELFALDSLKKIDVILIDYTSDGFNITDISKINTTFSNIKILAITPYINSQTIIQAVKTGVFSYVKKNCSAKEIIESIDETFSGRKFYCREIIKKMSEESIDIVNCKSEYFVNEEFIALSDRELEVIKYIAEGYTNAQIAAILYISNHTVNTHRKNILKKLSVNNTVGVVMHAIKTGLVSPDKFNFN